MKKYLVLIFLLLSSCGPIGKGYFLNRSYDQDDKNFTGIDNVTSKEKVAEILDTYEACLIKMKKIKERSANVDESPSTSPWATSTVYTISDSSDFCEKILKNSSDVDVRGEKFRAGWFK